MSAIVIHQDTLTSWPAGVWTPAQPQHARARGVVCILDGRGVYWECASDGAAEVLWVPARRQALIAAEGLVAWVAVDSPEHAIALADKLTRGIG